MDECNLHIIESVINITEERNIKSLKRSLISTLSKLIDCEGIILLRTHHNQTGSRAEICISSPKNIYIDKYTTLSVNDGIPYTEYDSTIKQCLEDKISVNNTSNEISRIVIPIFSDKSIECILDIYGHTPSEHSLQIIEGIVSIYSNFLSILHDNEHDTLTGLLNRKSFDHKFSELLHNRNTDSHYDLPVNIERRKEHDKFESWLAVLDIDHFKKVNDTFGHIYGDEVLLLFSDLLKSTFRSNDLLFRFGGEEFIVLINNTTKLETFNIFERFRKIIEYFEFPQVGTVTVSIGIVKADNVTPPVTLIEKADRALYYAKDHGRNQTRNYHELIDSGELKDKKTKDDIELF